MDHQSFGELGRSPGALSAAPLTRRSTLQKNTLPITPSKDSPAASANLDFLRAYAVLSVLAYHVLFIVANRRVIDAAWGMGRFGVLIFFVHTSLVLMLSLQRGCQSLTRPVLTFYIQRFFRIYPLAIACVAAALLFHQPGAGPLTASRVASNLALVQNLTFDTSIIGPMWSLPYEVQMYILLPGLFFIARRFGLRALLPLWGAAVVVGFVQPHVSARADIARYAPCFLGGIVAYTLKPLRTPRLPFVLWPVLLSVLLAIYMAVGQTHSYRIPGGWLIGIVLGLGVSEFREPSAAWIRRPAAWVARYSYGIYLLQARCLHLAFFSFKAPASIQWAAFAIVITVLPVLAYHLVESPCIRIGRTLARRLSAPASIAAHA